MSNHIPWPRTIIWKFPIPAFGVFGIAQKCSRFSSLFYFILPVLIRFRGSFVHIRHYYLPGTGVIAKLYQHQWSCPNDVCKVPISIFKKSDPASCKWWTKHSFSHFLFERYFNWLRFCTQIRTIIPYHLDEICLKISDMSGYIQKYIMVLYSMRHYLYSMLQLPSWLMILFTVNVYCFIAALKCTIRDNKNFQQSTKHVYKPWLVQNIRISSLRNQECMRTQPWSRLTLGEWRHQSTATHCDRDKMAINLQTTLQSHFRLGDIPFFVQIKWRAYYLSWLVWLCFMSRWLIYNVYGKFPVSPCCQFIQVVTALCAHEYETARSEFTSMTRHPIDINEWPWEILCVEARVGNSVPVWSVSLWLLLRVRFDFCDSIGEAKTNAQIRGDNFKVKFVLYR